MFKFNQIDFPFFPYLSKPLPADKYHLLIEADMSNWDREGYELLPIEQEIYTHNGINLSFKEVFAKESGQEDGWYSAVTEWAYQVDKNETFILDHSFAVVRYGYCDALLRQIKEAANYNKGLLKLVYTRPKYGLDFCLDAIWGNEIFEIVHFEHDFLTPNEAIVAKLNSERLIDSAKWDKLLSFAYQNREMFSNLKSEDVGDIKAKLFGLDQAFSLYKLF